MAIDTRNKRFALINLALPFGRVVPTPDGAISTQAERWQWLGLYPLGAEAGPTASGVRLAAMTAASGKVVAAMTAASGVRLTTMTASSGKRVEEA